MITIDPQSFFNNDEKLMFRAQPIVIKTILNNHKEKLKSIIPILLKNNEVQKEMPKGLQAIKQAMKKSDPKSYDKNYYNKTPEQTLVYIRKQLDALSTATQDHEVIKLFHLVTKIELQLNKKIQSRFKLKNLQTITKLI